MFVTRRALVASELREDEVTLELVLLAKFSHLFVSFRIYSLISSPAFSGVCALKHPTERFICSYKHSVLTPFPRMTLSLFSVSYGLTLVQQILSVNGMMNYLSNRKRFACLHSLIQTREGLGEFETFMQTRDEVEGLHNCREFSQPLECLYQAMQTQEKSFLLLL